MYIYNCTGRYDQNYSSNILTFHYFIFFFIYLLCHCGACKPGVSFSIPSFSTLPDETLSRPYMTLKGVMRPMRIQNTENRIMNMLQLAWRLLNFFHALNPTVLEIYLAHKCLNAIKNGWHFNIYQLQIITTTYESIKARNVFF